MLSHCFTAATTWSKISLADIVEYCCTAASGFSLVLPQQQRTGVATAASSLCPRRNSLNPASIAALVVRDVLAYFTFCNKAHLSVMRYKCRYK